MDVLWLNGLDGIGKSVVGFEIFRQVSDAGVTTAFLDLDQVNLCYPALDDDPGNYSIRAAGLAAVSATYRDAGVRCMVISGVAETPEIVTAHKDLLPDIVTVVRLRATPQEVRRRFVERGRRVDQADEVVQVSLDMDRNLVGDLCVDTDGLRPSQTADLVRAIAGDWPGLPSGSPSY